MRLLLEIINKNGLIDVVKNNLIDYQTSGVWALFGIENGKKLCLEVGQTANIYNELSGDVYIMKNINIKKCGPFRHKARRILPFNLKFDILTTDIDRNHAKYREILMNYDKLQFFIVANKIKSKCKREQVELEFAIDNKALYWNAWGDQQKKAWDYYNKTYSKHQV